MFADNRVGIQVLISQEHNNPQGIAYNNMLLKKFEMVDLFTCDRTFINKKCKLYKY